MHTLHTPDEARRFVWQTRCDGRTVGLVPTMGALHQGHLSLVRLSRRQCDETIVTIFVNPAQFGPSEDLGRYPRTLDADRRLLAAEGVSALFVPATETMYPSGFSTYIEPPEVAAPWEGVCRPGHFRGVATVVLKLLHALPATHVFFGRKDYQQWKVIEAMVRDLDVGVEVIAGETVREADGLAMSSRNRYLSREDRQRALRISQALGQVQRAVAGGQRDVAALQKDLHQQLSSPGEPPGGVDTIDYAVIADAETLTPLATLDRPAVALVAAVVGKTRLIDNALLSPT